MRSACSRRCFKVCKREREEMLLRSCLVFLVTAPTSAGPSHRHSRQGGGGLQRAISNRQGRCEMGARRRDLLGWPQQALDSLHKPEMRLRSWGLAKAPSQPTKHLGHALAKPEPGQPKPSCCSKLGPHLVACATLASPFNIVFGFRFLAWLGPMKLSCLPSVAASQCHF